MTILEMLDSPPVVIAVVIVAVAAWLWYTRGLPWGLYGIGGMGTRAREKAYWQAKHAEKEEAHRVGPLPRLVPPAPPKQAVHPRAWDE